jgi:hypothetical protein
VSDLTQPIQPIYRDHNGVERFHPNKIVQYLLDNGGLDLNDLARVDFPGADREQFHQLIGYSVSAWGGLSSTTDETWRAVEIRREIDLRDSDARTRALREMLSEARQGVRAAAVALFGIHPDDLGEPADD